MEVWRLSQELIPSRKLDIHVQFLWHLYQKIRPQFIAHGVADAMILAEIAPMFEYYAEETNKVTTVFERLPEQDRINVSCSILARGKSSQLHAINEVC